jgi:hypothetical protein
LQIAVLIQSADASVQSYRPAGIIAQHRNPLLL